MTEVRESMYNVGDVVRVVDTPYNDCPFHWIDEMDEYCGKEAKIISACWIEGHKAYGYAIDIDEYGCTWCENCFAVESDIEESGSDINTLFQ